MSQSRRDEAAEAVAKSAIVRLFGEDAIDRIDVFPTEDSSGEEGLSVTVFLKSADENVSGVASGRRDRRGLGRAEPTSTIVASLM